ncbi:MAG: ParB/RepB/Spo0J family partition protein [Candidatus Portnoybacteria bacterium]
METSLGKGLQSLIPKKESKISELIKGREEMGNLSAPKKESIFNIEIDKIRPNPDQPRKDLSEESLVELANSIREHGILQPLIVSKIEKTTERGRQVEYELIAGERRWRAARMTGSPSVPVIIRDSRAHEKLQIALVENIQRENLNAVESAMAFKRLQEDFGLRHQDIAEKIGKKRTTVTNMMRLLTLPSEIQQSIREGKISEGHGRAILLARQNAQMPVFREILRKNLSVRQAEERARKVAAPKGAGGTGPKNPLFKKLEKELQEVLGRRVSITRRGDLGHVRVEFTNQGELNQLVKLLSQS